MKFTQPMTSHLIASGRACLAAGLLLVPTMDAVAGNGGLWERASQVTDVVTNNGGGSWTYNYTVHNTSSVQPDGELRDEPVIVDWELPWFIDAGITNIESPFNWAFAIETIGTPNPNTGWDGIANWQDPGDPFFEGPDSPFTLGTEVLHWYSECWVEGANGDMVIGTLAQVQCEFPLQDAILAGDNLGGFLFDAAFDETDAPYQASWDARVVQTGDPAFPLGGIPASPLVVPVAPTLPLIAVGLIAALAVRRRAARR